MPAGADILGRHQEIAAAVFDLAAKIGMSDEQPATMLDPMALDGSHGTRGSVFERFSQPALALAILAAGGA